MKFPLIVSFSGDIDFYRTLSYAESSIEPIDVRNGDYTIYDADGFLMEPRIVKIGRIESVQIVPTDESRATELKNALIDFFPRIGHDQKVLETMALSQLIEIGKSYLLDKGR